MLEQICNRCGVLFNPSHFNQKLCSQECKKASRRETIKRYKKSIKGKNSNIRWASSEKRKQSEARYRSKQKTKELAVNRTKRYQEKHPEKVKIWREKCAKEYPKTEHGKIVCRTAQKKYRSTDKGKSVARTHKYKSRNPHVLDLDFEAWNKKLKEIGGLCSMCGSKSNITIDHIIPLSKGGSNHISNLQPLCRSCNSKKKDSLKGVNLESNLFMWT